MGTIFSTYDIRGRAGESLTTESAWNIGKAFAEWLSDEGNVILATTEKPDNAIVNAFTEGLLLQGRSVLNIGEGDQHAVTNAISEQTAAGGVLIAHDGLQDLEVITLYDVRGVAITDEMGLNEIAELVSAGNFVPAPEKGTLTTAT